ncbi:MAG: hypothetical protein WC279_15065, partial [Sulfurimonas sp.]|uniref:hypothetical protein n=1 Tax=Sulfurimonas sp. TaxID=2022749 RepID=UPI00356624E4
MSIFNRKLLAGLLKSFTTKNMQTPLDDTSSGMRDTRRRLDALTMDTAGRKWFLSAKIVTEGTTGGSASDYTWNIPQLMIKSDGVVENAISHTLANVLIKEMRMLLDHPVNKPYDPAWDHGTSNLPSHISKSMCVIPGFSGTDYAGAVIITPVDGTGDKLAADTLFTVRRTADAGVNAEADPDSYELLPDGTAAYKHWYLNIPSATDVTPNDVVAGLAGSSILTFFDVFSGQLDAATYIADAAESTFGFLRHPASLYLGQDAVTALFSKLTYVFDDDWVAELGTGIPQSLSVCIRLPQTESEDGGVTDISRYLTAEGDIEITADMLVYDYELATSLEGTATGMNSIIPFATRIDDDTVVLCDGTRIYRKRSVPNLLFKPAAGSRRYMLTGSGLSFLNLSVLEYTHSDGQSEGSIAPWSEEGVGYYDATTHLYTDGSESLKRVWENDKYAVTYNKYASGQDHLPLLTIARSNRYVSLGGSRRPASGTVYRNPPRDLKGKSLATEDYMDWNDSVLHLSAPSLDLVATDGTRCGLLFSRAFASGDYANGDSRTCSYLFEKYGLAATGDVTSEHSSGLFMVTNSYRLSIGATRDDFHTGNIESQNWRTATSWRGGDVRRSDAAAHTSLIFTVCRGGETFAESEKLPGVREYTQVSKVTRSAVEKWESLYFNRMFNEDGAASPAWHDDPRPHLGLMMWCREGAPEDSVMKLMRKVGDEGSVVADNVGQDLPGEVGLFIGKRGLSLSAPMVGYINAQLSANTEAGLSGYVPKVLVASDLDGLPFTFCGLT